MTALEDGPIAGRDHIRLGATPRRAFTLIELLVVISIISLLMAILLPALGKAKQQARDALNMSRQRQIAQALNTYSADNDCRFPNSIATIGYEHLGFWNWQDPMRIVGQDKLSPRVHRSMSAYLRSYIPDASIMYCPNAPDKNKHLKAAWEAGEEWDSPGTPMSKDPMSGTYGFYWNYTGYIEAGDIGGQARLFEGPKGGMGGRRQSTMLVSCYLGYDYQSNPDAYGSCERFKGATIAEGNWFTSSVWSSRGSSHDALPSVKMTAGYTDGHVARHDSSDTVTMKVILDTETNEPYPSYMGPSFGDFYIPRDALR